MRDRAMVVERSLAVAVGLWLALAGLPIAALAQSYTGAAPGHPQAAPTIDDEALSIANELQCPVCQNVTVAYSHATLAGEMRQIIRDKLAQGETRDQIVQYFVDRYGESILTRPPKRGLNLLVWLLPLAGLLSGLAVVARVLSARPSPACRAEAQAAGPLSADDERLLARALQGLD